MNNTLFLFLPSVLILQNPNQTRTPFKAPHQQVRFNAVKIGEWATEHSEANLVGVGFDTEGLAITSTIAPLQLVAGQIFGGFTFADRIRLKQKHISNISITFNQQYQRI